MEANKPCNSGSFIRQYMQFLSHSRRSHSRRGKNSILLLFNKNKTAPQPWQAIAQRFCSIGSCQVFQTASLHRNAKQIILKVGGGRNGKRR